MVKHLNFEEEKVKCLVKWVEEKVRYLDMLDKKKAKCLDNVEKEKEKYLDNVEKEKEKYLAELKKEKGKYLAKLEEEKAKRLSKLEKEKVRYLVMLEKMKADCLAKWDIIEDRTKAPEGEVMYSSQNGFFYLRSESGEGSNKSNCSFEDSFVSEVPRPLSWLIMMERAGYGPLCDDLEPWMYEPYKHVPTYYTTVLYGRKASKCRPSDDIKPLFYYIKYGEGLNKHWRVKWHDENKRKNKERERGENVGNLTKEECENKGNHGNYLSDEELIERAKGKGETAWNARRLLKRRGYALVSGEWVL